MAQEEVPSGAICSSHCFPLIYAPLFHVVNSFHYHKANQNAGTAAAIVSRRSAGGTKSFRSKCNSKEPDQVFEQLVVRRYKQEECSFIFYCALGEKEGEKQTVTETPWG
jgi:hypothetical protein